MTAETSPARVVHDTAVTMLKPGHELGFATDARSYPDRVLVGLARPGWSCVLQIPREEYGTDIDGAIRLANLLGFPNAAAPTAHDRARKQRAA